MEEDGTLLDAVVGIIFGVGRRDGSCGLIGTAIVGNATGGATVGSAQEAVVRHFEWK
jgi:hypothetical protein